MARAIGATMAMPDGSNALPAAAAATTTASTSTTIATPSPSEDAYHQLQQSPALPIRRYSVGRGRTGRQSSKFGTVNYSTDEMRRLNEKVRAVMPIIGEDWLHVAYQFNYMRPESIPYREVESLKRKFKKMYCTRSSVSGKLPEYIEEAKELRRLINLRCEKAHLDNSDTHSDMDAQEMATGLEQQQQQQQGGKAESFAAALVDASQGAAVIRSGNTTPNGHQAHANAGEAEASEMPVAAHADASDVVVDTLSTDPQKGGAIQELPQEATSTLTNQQRQPQHQDLPATSEQQFGSEAEVNDSRVIAAKLSAMEEEYRQAMAARHPARESVDSLASTATSLVASATSQQQLQHPQSQQQVNDMATVSAESITSESTSGIISMLKHSIERKRRTMEEQMLSESERVRKERKKRKMEQVLYSIHQEQREREALNASLEATTASIFGGPQHSSWITATSGAASGAGPVVQQLAGASAPPLPLPPGAQLTAEPSIGMMEIVLQYMVAQQTEMAQRLQAEQEQRARDQQAKEQRRREKERARRQEKREFMVVMAAVLEDRFPASLKHHLEEPSLEDEFAEETGGNGDDESGDGDGSGDGDEVSRQTSSTNTEEAVAERFESDGIEPQASDERSESHHDNEPTLI